MTAGRAVLVGLMHRYLSGLLDPFVTLLEVHKLMYFQQEAGEYIRLRYHKAPYGPYAENLRHVLHAVEGHRPGQRIRVLVRSGVALHRPLGRHTGGGPPPGRRSGPHLRLERKRETVFSASD